MDILSLARLISDTGVVVVVIASVIIFFGLYFRQKLNLDKILFLQRMDLDRKTADRNEENDKMQNSYRDAVLKQSESQINATEMQTKAIDRNTDKLSNVIENISQINFRVMDLPTKADVTKMADEMRALHRITHNKLNEDLNFKKTTK